MSRYFKEKDKKLKLASIGAPKDGNLPIEPLLFNIFHKLSRCANALKIIAYLIYYEQSCRDFRVDESKLMKFCSLGSNPEKAFKDLEIAGFIECVDSTIIIRYDKLLKE